MFETDVLHSGQSPDVPDSTRERLLDAAGEVFADKGFAQATVREICQAAGTNLASINYHFGSKERLYAEVLRHADELSHDRHPHQQPLAGGLAPEDQLGWFVRQFLNRIFDAQRPAWHDRVIARELVEPTPALEELAEKNIKPRAAALQGIIRRMLGPGASEREVQMHAASVVGQVLMYFRCRAMLRHVLPAIDLSAPGVVDDLSRHITGLCVRAMRARREELENDGATQRRSDEGA